MKRLAKQDKAVSRTEQPGAFKMKNGKFLSMEEIHGKGLNFLGNEFRV